MISGFLRILSNVFFHAFSDPDECQSDHLPSLLVVSNNHSLPHIHTQSRLWFSETSVERVGIAVVLNTIALIKTA